MRTTIQISNELRQKLIMEATARNLKGFSEIVSEALEQYFKSYEAKRRKMIKSFKGSLSKKDYEIEMKRLKEERNNWRD